MLKPLSDPTLPSTASIVSFAGRRPDLDPTPPSNLWFPRCSQWSLAAVTTWSPTPPSILGFPRRRQYLDSHAAVNTWIPTPPSILGFPRRCPYLDSHAAVNTMIPSPQSILWFPRRSQNFKLGLFTLSECINFASKNGSLVRTRSQNGWRYQKLISKG